MHRSNGPPRATKSELEMVSLDFGLGKNAGGRYNFSMIDGAGGGPTTLVGSPGALMANAG